MRYSATPLAELDLAPGIKVSKITGLSKDLARSLSAISVRVVEMSLIGKSVAQVYLSEAPAYHQRSELKQFTLKVIWSLSKLGLLPALAAGVGAPFIVPFVFGGGWERTGILIAWLTPCFFMQFLSAPVSMSLHITGNQKAALVLQVFGFFVRVGSVLLCGFYHERYVAEVYAISGLFFYAFYMLVIIKVLKSCER